MQRRRIAMTLSIPPEIAKEYIQLAKREAKNKSELFRDMWRFYKTKSLEQEFFELQRRGAKRARDEGVFNEDDVGRIVFESR